MVLAKNPDVKWRSLFAATAIATIVAGCGGGDEPLYSIPQVQEAFEGTGISLLDQEGSSVRRDTLTFSSYEYAVVVATASDAEYFWTDGSQEPIARRGNVVVLRLLGSPTSAEKKAFGRLSRLHQTPHTLFGS